MFYFISLFSVLFFLLGCASSLDSHKLEQRLLLKDEVSQIDGLDNPRTAKFNLDESQLFVASADDDSLAIFNVSKNLDLSLSQVFKNNEYVTGLRGANDVVISKDGTFAYVISFYDSALVIFKKSEHDKFEYLHTYSDKVKWWEYKGKPISSSLQKLALLGAYDIKINHDTKQLYIASSISNAVSIFDINKDGFPIFSHAIRDTHNINYGLTGTVDVLLSQNGAHLFTAGYNENSISIFSFDDNKQLNFKQTLINNTNGIEHLDKPQSMSISTDYQILYVACGSGSIVAFRPNGTGQYQFLQSIQNSDLVKLGGAASINITPDNKTIFVAAETDHLISIFSVNQDGTLTYESMITNEEIENNSLLGISSINLSPNADKLLVTSGKGDALSIFDIN